MTEAIDVQLALPGDPEAIQQLASHLQRAAGQLSAAADRVAAIGAPGTMWEGPVAHAFLEHVSLLSSRFQAIDDELRRVAADLLGWHDGLLDRRARLAAVRDEVSAASIGPGEEVALGETDRLRAQAQALVDENEAAATGLAQTLRRGADATVDPAGALDGTAWLLHAEQLLHDLDAQIGGWVSAQGPALSEAVSSMAQSTAVGATVGQAVGSLTPGLHVAMGAAVMAVASAAPGSHRLIAAARTAHRPVPIDALPVASFAARRK